MRTDTRTRIITYITTHRQARVHDLVREFGMSQVAIHKQLKKLVTDGILAKTGKPPFVFYILAVKPDRGKVPEVSDNVRNLIDKEYLYVSPRGELLYGFAGFNAWAKGINEEKQLIKLALEYAKMQETIKKQRSGLGWIDATDKIKNTFTNVFVDKLLYGDFYSLPKFGKTKLGQLVLYAKQSQNRMLIKQLSEVIKPLIERIIREFAINATVFIPPTVPRRIQFMHELTQYLNLSLPRIELVKTVSGQVIVAQKTLARLEERIINAQETIFIKQQTRAFSRALLIDDAAGSGATFNETAKKLKAIGIGKGAIIAFAIVGSFKGFDVIREV